MIDCDGNDRHRNAFVDEIRLRCGVHCLTIDKFRTTYNRVFGKRFGFCNLSGLLGGEGTVKSATDFTAFLRSQRIDGEVGIETCCREETVLGFVIVIVFF